MSEQQPGMSLADFMNHSSRGSGGKKSYLRGWKDKPPHAVTVWLSCRASINALWRHNFQRVEPREDKQTHTKSLEVWQNKLTCWETEENLRKMYWRDKSTGARDYPPVLCPHCKMIEDVYQRVHTGELDWLTPLFKFEGSDPSKTVILHAGGLFNAFGAKDLTGEQKQQMAAVTKANGGPIFAKSAWRENNQPKMEYVYCVVNHDDVASGVNIAIETSLLGDKMKTAIAQRMKSVGEQEGNPILHPYAFRWEYNPLDGVEFNKKYEAFPYEKVKLTPAVEKLIRDTDPPDLGPLLEKFNLKTHRARLEEHALVELPWDSYFEAAFKHEGSNGAAKAAETAERRTSEVRTQTPKVPPAKPQPTPEPERVLCDTDGCGQELLMTDPECPKCGAKYDVQGAPEPPKPKLPTRSEAKAKAAAATTLPAPAAKGSLGPLAPPSDAFDDGNAGGYPGDASDDIPFASNSVLTWCADGVACEAWEYGRRFVEGSVVFRNR